MNIKELTSLARRAVEALERQATAAERQNQYIMGATQAMEADHIIVVGDGKCWCGEVHTLNDTRTS